MFDSNGALVGLGSADGWVSGIRERMSAGVPLARCWPSVTRGDRKRDPD